MKLRKVLALVLALMMLASSAAFAVDESQLADPNFWLEGQENPKVSLYADIDSGAMLSMLASKSEDYGFDVHVLWPHGATEYYYYDLEAKVDLENEQPGLTMNFTGTVYVNGVEEKTSSGTLNFYMEGEENKMTWQEDGVDESYAFVFLEDRPAADDPVFMVVPSVFDDVDAAAYYSRAVNWAAENEITTGKGDNKFDPDATVTRAEAVTFLWRLAGRPDPTQTETFDDVVNDANKVWYETAVQWAVEQGITNGTGDNNFSPTVTCDRAMILTMLYRMEGKPWDEALAAEVPEEVTSLEDLGNGLIQAIVENIRTGHPFTDMEEGDYFEIPVLWSFVNGILDTNQVAEEAEAVGATTACVRGEMAWFLYRAAEYEKAAKEAQDAYDKWNTPPEPIQVGTIEKTVVMDKDGIKITADSIEYDEDSYDAVLHMTMENGSKKQIYADVASLFVNTYHISSAAQVAVEEDGWTSYDSVIVPAGETREFEVTLNDLREKGILSVNEIEIKMLAYEVTATEDGYDYEGEHVGEPVTVKTSLYDAKASYDQEGTVVYDKDGLKVLITKVEQNEYMGPQISVYTYNGGKEKVSLELVELKLDGETYQAYFSTDVEPGKRDVDTISIEFEDYDNLPTPQEAQITLEQVAYDEDWNATPVVVFDPVTVTFDGE